MFKSGGQARGERAYTLTRLIDTGLARMPWEIAKLVLDPLVRSDGDRLGNQVLGRLLAVLDGNGRGRGVT